MRWYDLPDLLPPVYAGVRSMYETAETENTELKGYYAIRDAVLANMFPQTCDVKTIQYWEQLLDIELYGDETIEERRKMIMIYLVSNFQITRPYVFEVGEGYFGEGNFTIDYDPDNHLIVEMRMYNAEWNATKRFVKWFEKVCPAHIQWFAGPTYPSNSDVVSIARGIVADKMRMSASCSAGTGITFYLGENAVTADWVEV